MKKSTQLRESLANISFKKLIYPLIVGGYSVIIGILFFVALNFLVSQIDNALTPPEESAGFLFDQQSYELVAKKLDISLTALPIAPQIPSQNTTSTAPKEASSTTVTLNKRSLVIAIYNGSGKIGAAATLKKHLEDGGFTIKETGNEQSTKTTVIKIKESKKAYLESIIARLVSFPLSPKETTLPEENTSDVIIIIGQDSL